MFSGDGRAVPLDWGTELWQWESSRFEARDAITESLRRGQRDVDENAICYEATRSLLPDVLDAAGGVEGANIRLHQAMERAATAYTNGQTTAGLALPEGSGVQDPATEDAWYSIEELMFWARTLDERLCRNSRSKDLPRQGLIPALADGPQRAAVVASRSNALNATFGECRFLANLNLHMQSTNAGSKSARVRQGQLVLAFPDRVTAPIGHRWQLTYHDDRDALTFADNVLADVEALIDTTLAAFETHLPQRFRTG